MSYVSTSAAFVNGRSKSIEPHLEDPPPSFSRIRWWETVWPIEVLLLSALRRQAAQLVEEFRDDDSTVRRNPSLLATEPQRDPLAVGVKREAARPGPSHTKCTSDHGTGRSDRNEFPSAV